MNKIEKEHYLILILILLIMLYLIYSNYFCYKQTEKFSDENTQNSYKLCSDIALSNGIFNYNINDINRGNKAI